MRFLAIALASLVGLAPAMVHAESGEAMRARGEQLAKDGRFTEAIDAFKAAERIEPRARHACLIALAYTRRKLWPQAEIFLEQCEQRATPADPLPEWVPVARRQLAERLATANVAPVTIAVAPPGVPVRLAVSSFAPDEQFAPRTIHLPPGRHVILATADGYTSTEKTIEVVDRTAKQVVITLRPTASAAPSEPVAPIGGIAAPAPTAPSKVPLVVMGAGGVVALAGVAVHLFVFKPARDALVEASEWMSPLLYDDREAKFDTSRTQTIGLYAVGALTVVTGAILHYTVFKRSESPVQVSVQPGAGGGMVTVGWTR